MKKSLLSYVAIATLILSAIGFVSCSDDDDEDKTGIDALIEQGILYGELNHEATLNASTTYKLTGTFSVENGGTLTIPAGTKIEATEGYGSYIIVAQGGKININGTASAPVIMTADNETKANSGYWGGLILNGKAKISGASDGATAKCEMNPNYTYGGTDDNDNSGSITYLAIKYAGARSSKDVEHNGLTLDAVGSGTKIENIFVYENADDGIECFGGTVDLKNILVVNEDDDMFDNTQGYRGKWTNLYGVWEKGFTSTEDDPRGIESDGNFDGKTPTDINQTNFTVTNITFALKLDYDADAEENGTLMHDVIKIRRHSTATITNALVTGTGAVKDLVDCTDKKGCAENATSISITNSLTNTISGNEAKKTFTKDDGTVLTTNATVTVGTSNTGCEKSIFAWTGYSF